jgi:hypothetical protein
MFDQPPVNTSSITIEIVENGFIVVLPVRYSTTQKYQDMMVRREAQYESIFRTEVETDSEIKRLQGKSNDDDLPFDEKFIKMTVSEAKNKNILVFKTLPEALQFIQDEFKN